MPKSRQPYELWNYTRRIVWERDGECCTHCGIRVSLEKAHIDHRISGKRGTNELKNLRTLCYRCHALRADMRHRGMCSSALRKGIIPPNWRELVWDD